MRVYRQRDSRVHPLLKILLIAVVVVATSFCLAWVWHTTEQAGVALEAPDMPAEPMEEETAPMEEPENPAMAPPEQEVPEEEEAEDSDSDTAVVFSGAVPESAAVDAAYFDDAIFIGDSITTGIPLYHIADNAAVVAMNGINTQNINDKEWIDLGGESRVTVLEACRTHPDRSKVYILLGGNSIGYDKETFISGYEQFLGSVKELYPDAVIYLQSITPVVEGYVNEFDPEYDNEKIDDYNLAIMDLAKRKNVYYLDIASALKDEHGALPKEASPVDGLHFSPEYYMKWFDYLKTHTVEEQTS